MRCLLLAGLTLCLTVPCAVSQGERFDFKGVKLGGSREEFKAKLPLWQCRDSDNRVLSDLTCYGNAKFNCRGTSNEDCVKNFGYAGIQPSISVFFYGDSLSSVYIKIDSADFEQVSQAISERYGKPERDEVEEIVTRMGARFTNVTRTWRKADSRLTIEKYSGRVGEGSVSYRLDSHEQEFNRRKGDQAKKGAGNL